MGEGKVKHWASGVGQTDAAESGLRGSRNPDDCRSNLPVEFQGKLKLPRIVSGSGLARVGKERADGGGIVLIGDVERIRDQIHIEALAKVEASGDTEIVENGPGLNPRVAPKVAVEREQRAVVVRDAGFLKNSRGRVLRADRGITKRSATRIDDGIG